MESDNIIAALFVMSDGPYFGLPNIDPWDIKRDARQYCGPYKVIAHPPCASWSSLAPVNEARYSGYKIGDDGGCFESALNAVERYKGILEHPARSIAFTKFGLGIPSNKGWMPSRKGWIIEVSQGFYGHVMAKRTWLYCVSKTKPQALIPGAAKTDITYGGAANNATKKQALETPAKFKELLIELAKNAD